MKPAVSRERKDRKDRKDKKERMDKKDEKFNKLHGLLTKPFKRMPSQELKGLTGKKRRESGKKANK